MASKRFTKEDLTRSAASAKRTFIRRAKKGIYLTQKLTKEEAISKIAATLNVSERSLYTEERKTYLEEWYQSLLEDVRNIHEDQKVENNISSIDELRKLTIEQLIEENILKEERLKAYKTKVSEQELTIEKLLKKVIEKHERIEKL